MNAPSGPLAPNLWEMKVARALLRICAGDPRLVGYAPDDQAEVIGIAEYARLSRRGRRREGRETLGGSRTERSLTIMATDPMEILRQRDAEVAQIRGFADLTEEAKNRRIAAVQERARAYSARAREAAERERAERLERSERAVFRVPIYAGTTDAEEAQIHAAYRAAYNDVHSATSGATVAGSGAGPRGARAPLAPGRAHGRQAAREGDLPQGDRARRPGGGRFLPCHEAGREQGVGKPTRPLNRRSASPRTS